MIKIAEKRRRKGMVCVCVWENYEHWQLKQATGRLQIIQGTKITRGVC